MKRSAAERFWPYVQFTDSCWLWGRSLDKDGYGKFSHQARIVRTHRYAYEFCVEEIPGGLTIDHRCRVRHCVNPDHLEVVTNRENVLRGMGISATNARKTHCIHGHEFTEENTWVNPRYGWRHCRSCGNADQKRYNRKRVASSA